MRTGGCILLSATLAMLATPAPGQPFAGPRFQPLGSIAVEAGTAAGHQAMAVADLDGDGQPDLVAIRPGSGRVSVHRQVAAGRFESLAMPELGFTPVAVSVADFAAPSRGAADGLLDLAVGGTGGELAIVPGHGDGSFAAPEPATGAGAGRIVGLAAGDFDAAPGADLIVLDDATVFALCNDGGALAACGAAGGIAVSGTPSELVAGDFDADGRRDVAVLLGDAQRVLPLFGDGAGGFTAGALVAVAGEAGGDVSVDLAVARLDADATDDLVVVNDSNFFQFLAVAALGRSNRSFRVRPFVVDFVARAVTLADFDRDAGGAVDAVVGYGGSNARLSVNLGDGSGEFTDPFVPPGVSRVPAPVLLDHADLDGDGHPDLLGLDSAGGVVSLLRNVVPASCPGDCDGSQAVSIGELIGGVSMALGGRDPRDCLSLQVDSSIEVAIYELIAAVEASLGGCPVPR